jgi:hypothetical protein
MLTGRREERAEEEGGEWRALKSGMLTGRREERAEEEGGEWEGIREGRAEEGGMLTEEGKKGTQGGRLSGRWVERELKSWRLILN